MLCHDIKCHNLSENRCIIYSTGGMDVCDRRGYCPVVDQPKKVTPQQVKERQGQQKQKKRGRPKKAT